MIYTDGVILLKVSNQLNPNTIKTTDQPLEYKQGDIVTASVKERLPNNEAIVQIRNKEVRVVFEDNIPKQDRIAIQFTGNRDGIPHVRTVSSNEAGSSVEMELQHLYRSLGIQDSPELKAVAKLFIDRGQPLNRSTMEQLKNFIDKSTGPLHQKLETVKALIDKGIEITAFHLKSVHEALHGRALSASLQDLDLLQMVNATRNTESSVTNATISKTIDMTSIRAILLEAMHRLQMGMDLETSLKWLMQQLQLQQELPQVLQEAFIKNIQKNMQMVQQGLVEDARQQMIESLQQAVHPQLEALKGKANEQVINILQQLKDGANVHQTVETIRKHVAPMLPDHLQNEVGRKLQEVERLISNRQERRAMTMVTNVLDQLETTLSIQDQVNEQMDELMATTGLSSLDGSTKQFIVTEITRKMSQLAIDFKGQKRDIIRNLDNIINTIQVAKSQSYAHVKSLLETTIDTLDRMILKSEILLYSDMKSEKQLLVISSQLTDAKKALAKGDHGQALQILHSAKENLMELNIRPANVKTQHMLMQEMARKAESAVYKSEQIQFEQLAEKLYPTERTARTVYEAFRALGLNYDSEMAQSLSNRQYTQEQLQNNMKAILLKLIHGEEEQSSQQRSTAEHILHHITGQQLLSKFDVGHNLQTMYLNLPYQMNGQQGDLKVYINGKKEGEKIDWENCNIYFLLETKKLGDIGVLISASNRNLSITIKNDQSDLKERMLGIVGVYKDRISEIGYNVTGIHFTPLNRNDSKLQVLEKEEGTRTTAANTGAPNLIKRGFDSRI